MRGVGTVLGCLLLLLLLATACTTPDTEPGPEATPAPQPSVSASASAGASASASAGVPEPSASATPPLAGRVIVLDPGHQLGNRSHPAEIATPVDAGGFEKACNTTGTSTDAGYPEATFAWLVAEEVRRQLLALGAQVVMTRETNDAALWGPCVDERGSLANPDTPSRGLVGDVRISIHGDGSLAPGARGFHVIRPGQLAGWTDDIATDSRPWALAVRDALVAEGFATSTYLGSGGIDVRTDLGTLNHSDIPAVMAELGNMRDPGDAAVMTSTRGQRRYATALVAAVTAMLG